MNSVFFFQIFIYFEFDTFFNITFKGANKYEIPLCLACEIVFYHVLEREKGIAPPYYSDPI